MRGRKREITASGLTRVQQTDRMRFHFEEAFLYAWRLFGQMCACGACHTLVGLAVSLGSCLIVYTGSPFNHGVPKGCLSDSPPRFSCFRGGRPPAARCTVESDVMKHPLLDICIALASE